ncbi:TonB-dependent receptor domain-containing protein [Salinimicrobium sediminilitoris]|uniref:TonB-dependent receptor domain-containing protein n=1 Tax=Salinimicrobium sediminilitoris TaxID=2876715 RepID=UPI001E5D6EAB|nr:TonB-dependent receptor [Salinimicrobium sediminilitoris]MCC8360720.1 TonB-dependent receptor [Salinimicrobium sediminilitoris]
MRKYLFLLSIFLFFGNLSAQNIKGKVVDAFTSKPLEKVKITSEKLSEPVYSGPSGEFLLSLEELPVNVIFDYPGYGRKVLHIENYSEDLIVLLAPSEGSLSEVVLRSTIIPQELLQTPSAVSVLSGEELERFDETNIMQNFSTVPGVNVHQGALNTNKMSIRGVGARSQYSTNRVKAYFMEIPITSAEGETTLDDLDPAVVERVEIIKGPTSSVYGAGLGGVITLFPARAEEQGTNAKVKGTYGSYNLIRGTVQASHASESSNLVATYNHVETDGWRDNSAYNRDSFTMFGQVAGGENGQLSVLGHFVRLKAFIPSSLNRETLLTDPSSAAFTWGAAKGYESYDKGLLGLSYKYNFSETFHNTTSIYGTFRDAYEPRPFDILNEEQTALGARTKFNLEGDFLNAPSRLSFGMELYNEWYDIATYENLYEQFEDEGSVPGINLSHNEQDRIYYNFFFQWNLQVTSRLKLEAGLNLNSTSYELSDLYEEDEVDQSGDYTFEDVLSPRFGAVYSVSPGKNFYASVSHGFSTPTVAETLTPEGLINTSLKPETGINYEAGFKGNFLNNRLYAEVAAFSIQVDNLLVAERVAEDQYIGRNAGKTDHNGLELLLNYNFPIFSALRARTFVNAAYNSFSFDEFIDEEEDFSGNDLPAVPQETVNAGLDLITSFGLSLRTTYQYEGQMPLNDANTEFRSSYDLLHFKASLKPLEMLSPGVMNDWEFEIFGGVNNALDEKYAASVIPNAVGFGGAAPRYFYPGMPQNFYGGLAVGYKF